MTNRREVPEGTQRKQVKSTTTVRSYVRSRTDEENVTYSELLTEWLPEPSDDYRLGYDPEDIVKIKITPEAYARVGALAGKRVTMGDVVALYAFQDALNEENYEDAAEIILEIPELLWQQDALPTLNPEA